MKKYKFLSLLLTFVLLAGILSPSAYAIEDVPDLKSASIYLADSETGYVYYERQADLRMYPASLTKMMTALLVIEAVERGELTLEEDVTAQPDFDFDMDPEGSMINLVTGETMTVKDLLNAILIASANDATNVIAAHLYGTVPAFVAKMNERAQQLGCTGTNFVNPHGLHNENHYTTAKDMFLIAQEGMRHELFVSIVDSIESSIDATNKTENTRGLTNTNGLITSASTYKGYYYEPAIGIKTGTTQAAGLCLASSAKARQIHPICIILGGVMTEYVNGQLDHSNYSDSIKLYDWVFSNYARVELVEGEALMLDVPVKLGSNADMVSLRAENSVTGVLPVDADLSQVQQNITVYSNEKDLAVKAPFDEGTVLGEVSVIYNGVEYGKTYLVANRSVDLSYIAAMFDSLLSTLSNPIVRVILILAVFGAIAYGVLFTRITMERQRRQREQAEEQLRKQKLVEQAKREKMLENARHQSYFSTNAGKKEVQSYKTVDYFDEMFPE